MTTDKIHIANRTMNRRGFLATLSVGGAALATLPRLAAAQDATPVAVASPMAELVPVTLPATWDQEADVVVVGTGAAGMSAAVTAAQSGASVIILEKGEMVGGTTQISGNTFWIPNNSKMTAIGLTDPRDDAIRYMCRLAYPQLYDADLPNLGLLQHNYDMIAAFYDNGSVAVDKFEEWGALFGKIQPSFGFSEMNDVSDPDYHADLPENKAPYGRPLIPDGDRNNGLTTIPTQMQAWTDAKGIPLLLSHRVTGVFQNDAQQVVGVQVDNAGTVVNVRAKKAVIFGSGGFTQDQFKSLNYLRGPVFAGCGVGTNTGDFVDIALALGARMGNMNQAWWLQCPLELAVGSTSLPGADVWMPYGDSMVIVNKYGDRVMTEKITYNERGQVHHIWDPTSRNYKNLALFMIYDDAVAQNPTEWPFRWPVPAPGDDSNLVISGATWEELASNIDARLDGIRGMVGISARVGADVALADNFLDHLSATIERFNGFATSGVDEDFGRGTTPIQIAWNGPAREGNTANPTMFPFASEGPYHCILLGPMTLDTKGGPVTDTSARVMAVDGSLIEGLYAAGNCSASPAGQAYWSAGGTIGPAMTFGFLAGLTAATEAEKPV